MIQASFFKSIVRLSDLPHDNRAHVAMVGRSNVGKSSMINNLTYQKNLARVSSEPGRTQTINLYDIGSRFYLVDLPGYGYAKTSKDKRAAFAEIIHDYLYKTPQLKLVLVIIDARIPLSDLDAEMIEWLQSCGTPFILILNKIDKVKMNDAVKLNQLLERKYPGVERIEHSSLNGKNRDKLWTTIESTFRSAT